MPLLEAFFAESSRTQAAGSAHEVQLCIEHSHHQHVGFSYKDDVTVPVRVYIGTEDGMISPSAVQHWADGAKAKNVEVVVVEKGTHELIMLTHAMEAMEKLFT